MNVSHRRYMAWARFHRTGSPRAWFWFVAWDRAHIKQIHGISATAVERKANYVG